MEDSSKSYQRAQRSEHARIATLPKAGNLPASYLLWKSSKDVSFTNTIKNAVRMRYQYISMVGKINHGYYQ